MNDSEKRSIALMDAFNPFRDIEAMMARPFGAMAAMQIPSMKADVVDWGDRYEVTLDMPGFKKEDIHLDVEDDVLIVTAERHSDFEDKDKQGKYVRCERRYGSFSRAFPIADVKAAEIDAAYDGGVLHLTMPKKAEEMPEKHSIEIK